MWWRRWWTLLFIGVFTLGAIAMEVVAGVWAPIWAPLPWTWYISHYVPWPVQLLVYLVLVLWLPFHFWHADHVAKKAHSAGFLAGLTHADYQSRLAESDPANTYARRGSAMEAFLKAARDEFAEGGTYDETRQILDNLLDRYREHADTGTPLDVPLAGPHAH